MELDIGTLLYKKEDETLEYKEGFDKDDIASTIAAFSTEKGGYILIGVTNGGMPIGYKCSEEEIRAKIYDISKNLNGGRGSIEIEFSSFNLEKKTIIIKVHEGERKPYGWKGVFYRRVDSSDEKLESEEITTIKLKSKNLTFDKLAAKIYNRKANISDVDEDKLKNYIKKANTCRRNRQIEYIDPRHFLKNLDVLTNETDLMNSALLIFGKKPQDSFPNSKINFLIYSGDIIDNSKLKIKRFIEGDIINQIEKAFSLIKVNTENRVRMDGLKRIEINQYPLNAIREAIINAIAHRDYSIFESYTTIRLFDNRLEIINPGGLMEGINLEDLMKGGHHSVRRNLSICTIFDNLGYMEQSGQGIKSMINAMTECGLEKPKITTSKSSFKIEFKGQKIEGELSEKLVESSTDLAPMLTDKQREGLMHIKTMDNPQITIQQYMDSIDINTRITATRHLERFKELGILEVEKIGKFKVYRKKI